MLDLKFCNTIGVYDLTIPWVPTIAHIARRAALLDITKSLPRGSVIEFGCGSGALLIDLEKLGFLGKGVDVSDSAKHVARRFHAGADRAFEIVGRPAEGDWKKYDVLLSVEVLEHIEDDVEALRKWTQYLAPAGTAIISVPAHRKLWGKADEWAGHVRRYDRADLVNLLKQAGFDEIEIRSYGFPLVWLLTPLREAMSRRKLSDKEPSTDHEQERRTHASGVDRSAESKLFSIYANPVARCVLGTFCVLQRLFYRSNLGTGFAAIARRVPKHEPALSGTL